MATDLVSSPEPAVASANRTWLWSQRWSDVLFAHWQAPVESLRPYVPAGLDIDTRDGSAWISIVAFRLEGVRRRWLPSVWPVSAFPELNLRTYVRYRGESAIYFLSIHAGRWLANCLARRCTPLPYVHAPIWLAREQNHYRFHCPGLGVAVDCTVARPVLRVATGTLDEWLLERYGLYVDDSRGRLLHTVVQHPRWEVSDARATIETGRLLDPFEIEIRRAPAAVHFSNGVHALIEPFAPVD